MSHDNPGSETPQFTNSVMRSTAESEYANTLATPEQSGPSNVHPGIGSLTEGQGSVPSSEDGRLRVLRELESCIETFRRGNCPKSNAISSILRVLGANSDVSLSQPQKEATFDSYLTEILSIQSTLDESGGTSATRTDSQETPDTPVEVSHKRRVERGEKAREDESEDEGDKPSKKPKLDESDMPWFTSSLDSSSDHTDPSCKETCRLLRIFNQDIAKSKFFVKIAPNSPSGIPSSQWERILKGDAVDLNQIFASLHHVVPDEERTGRLGDTEISFGVTEAKKRINSASEWSSAWRRASKAVSFAFPHRREELLEYGDYIESEFAAKLNSSHHKLILYDIALRNEVAGGQRALLTDKNKFSRLYSAIVLPDGVESQPKGNNRKPSTPQQGGKPEICNKFNAGTCKNSDSDCKYRHICKQCGKSGHPKKDCKEGSG